VGRTNATEAITYCQRFLEPVQPRYAALHDLTGRGAAGSEFFTMVRTKPLHGMTPAAVALPSGCEVIAWWIGVDGIDRQNHLLVDASGKLHVSGCALAEELHDSLNSFSSHLRRGAGVDADGRTPRERWQRGLWARFCPSHVEPAGWMARGEALGIPA